MYLMYRLFPIVALAVCLPFKAPAQILSPSDAPDVSRVSIHPGWSDENGERIMALIIDLEPGWKTYWRAPGDAGIPPHFDWTGSENIGSAVAVWPIPRVFDSYGMQTVGYDTRLVLPFRIEPLDSSLPVHVQVDMRYGICEDICIPAQAHVSMELDPGDGFGIDPEIEAVLQARPTRFDQQGAGVVTCVLEPDQATVLLTARIPTSTVPMTPELVVIEAPVRDLWIAPSQLSVDETGYLIASTTMEYFGEGPLIVERGQLRMTVLGDGQAMEILGCAVPNG